MTLYLCQTGAEADRLSFSLGEKVEIMPGLREAQAALASDLSEQLLIVGADIPMNQVRELMESYRTTRPELGVILIRRRLDVVVMNEAIQVGVREVIAHDSAEELINACRRSLAVSRRISNSDSASSDATHSGKVVVVFSAKGGCGKTTLSINLAQGLAMDKDTKVCLVDFDLQFGDVAVALHVEPIKNISNIMALGSNVDMLAMRSVVVSKESNFDLLLAPNNPADVERIGPEFANAVLTNLRNLYDYVIVDSPPAFTEVILKTFDLADACLFLTTLDMPAIKNLRVSLQTLNALGFPSNVSHIVVNRSDAKAGLTVEDVETAVGKKIMARIPTSRDVPATTNAGKTIVKEYPKHKVAKEIMNIASYVREVTGGLKASPKSNWLSNRRNKK